MLKLTMLFVLVTGVGGPRRAQEHRSPNAPALGSLIEVAEPATGLLATSRFGSIALELERGKTYTVTVRLGPGERQCGHTRSVKTGREPIRLHLYCSVP